MESQVAQTQTVDPARDLFARGMACWQEHRLDEAAQLLHKAAVMVPQNLHVRLKFAQVLLSLGELPAGFREFDIAHQLGARGNLPAFPTPQWNGMRLPHGRILLAGDQGFGDTIQYARYIPMVAKRCREVILGCSEELAPLVSGIPGIARTVTRWEDAGPCGVHSRLSYLPLVFGTEVRTIPAPIPYLKADPQKIAAWGERLRTAIKPGTLRAGVVWAGRPTHANDKNRSMALAQLQTLLDIPGVSFIALQKDIPETDRAALAGDKRILPVGHELNDFGDTAALVENLDLVISVDTSIVHLAGALGKKTWVLLPYVPDWRWLYDREDSPWYPSLRLFRQDSSRNWAAPVAQAAAALCALTSRPVS